MGRDSYYGYHKPDHKFRHFLLIKHDNRYSSPQTQSTTLAVYLGCPNHQSGISSGIGGSQKKN